MARHVMRQSIKYPGTSLPTPAKTEPVLTMLTASLQLGEVGMSVEREIQQETPNAFVRRLHRSSIYTTSLQQELISMWFGSAHNLPYIWC